MPHQGDDAERTVIDETKNGMSASEAAQSEETSLKRVLSS